MFRDAFRGMRIYTKIGFEKGKFGIMCLSTNDEHRTTNEKILNPRIFKLLQLTFEGNINYYNATLGEL